MLERILHGPMEFLAPDKDLNGVLEIEGIPLPKGKTFTTHIFLEEIAGDSIAQLIQTANYAGAFSIPNDAAEIKGDRATIRVDVTEALRKAEQKAPNFHITFITETDSSPDNRRMFHYESVHILHHVPDHTDLDISADVMCGLASGHKNSS